TPVPRSACTAVTPQPTTRSASLQRSKSSKPLPARSRVTAITTSAWIRTETLPRLRPRAFATTRRSASRMPSASGPASRARPGRGARFVPFELIEVAQRTARRPRLCAELHQLFRRDLAERALDAEVREVQVLLVDDRGDTRIDLDHVVAHELDVEEVLDAELA